VLKETEWVEEDASTSDLTGGYELDDEEFYRSLPAAESSTNSGFIESHVGLEFDELMGTKEDILV